MTTESERLKRQLARAIDRLAARGAAPADLLAWRGQVEPFATNTQRRREALATAAYQDALEAAYQDWLAAAAPDLAAEDDDDAREELLGLLLLGLLTRLRALGASTLPTALSLGTARAGGPARTTSAMYALLDNAIRDNDNFLTTSLIPAIGDKVRLALSTGVGDALTVIRSALESVVGRVRQYGNSLYALSMQVVGEGSAGEPVYWSLDDSIPPDRHCPDCLAYGNREYRSYDDMLNETGGLFPGSGELADAGNCRCFLEPLVPGFGPGS